MLRSPFFYVGDKYKLMPQLLEFFPDKIDTYYEPFLGGGSSFLYVEANKYELNDINKEMIKLHKLFKKKSNNPDEFYKKLVKKAREYELSVSCEGDEIPNYLKKDFLKTYYAIYNKESYLKLRTDYNETKDTILLYLLLIYGFNHMIRFNKKNKFNLPVGNVDFNTNVKNSIYNYLNISKEREINYHSHDYKKFLKSIKFQKNDFIYLDPPYLISNSEYNKFWSEDDENELYEILDNLDSKGVKFGLSNILVHKGVKNNILDKWKDKYNVKTVKSNYISFNDNSQKFSKEIYVTNIKE